MLRVNFEVVGFDNIRQIGELHIQNTGEKRGKYTRYTVRAWLDGDLLNRGMCYVRHARKNGAFVLAEKALKAINSQVETKVQ